MIRNRLIVYYFLMVLLLSACQPTTQAPANTPLPPVAPVAPATEAATIPAVALELVGLDSSKTFSMDELKALPATEGLGGFKSSIGKITPPAPFKGVALKDLVALVGKFDQGMGVNLVAQDGYAITFSYDQVMKGAFTEYDPTTGDELKIVDPAIAIIAYEINDQPLDPQQDGSLRLAVVSKDNLQVVDGHWTVKWVTRIEVKSLQKEWSLGLTGAISDTVDIATFQSCAAPNCHGASWKDDKAQEWQGVPLWWLVGRVDDENKHGDGAFNEALAAAGYNVTVVAGDGYSTTLDISSIMRNNNVIVAYQVNGNPLPDKYFPLRLVGSDLQKNQMVGTIANILVDVGLAPKPAVSQTEEAPAATEAPTSAAESSKVELLVTGLVEQELKLNDISLKKLEVVKITAEHPKKGKMDYEGVRLNTLLDLAKVKLEATKLILTASDGYSSEIDLASVRSCKDCLVAFSDQPGLFNLVMPGLESSLWIKEVVKIEVK